ncbi:MAG: endonuclease domain-containing protein [Dehalococcoidia bacterium]|nr:MAG: endonuclease domain-containing protein [Dehalococcoidia bacterium]
MVDVRQIGLARELRRNQTDAEKMLWNKLRALRCQGGRFRRQHPIGDYIVDFCCLEAALIIELDGGHHNEDSAANEDEFRTAWLQKRGYIVLGFWNNDVLSNLDGVLMEIGERFTLTPVSP